MERTKKPSSENKENECSHETKERRSPIHMVATSPSKPIRPTQPEDIHITFITTRSVGKVVFAPRIMDAKNVFLVNNINYHVHQYISASSISAIEDLRLVYNMCARVDKFISTPSVTNVLGSVHTVYNITRRVGQLFSTKNITNIHGSVCIVYNITGRVGRLISTLNITNIHGSVCIVYNITAPVDLLVTDLTVVNVQGSVYINFNVSSHINKHISLLMITNVRGDIYINCGSRTADCFSTPSNWLSELQTSLPDKSSLLQTTREAASCNNPDAPLKVYVECLEMERRFLDTLGIIECVQARKRHHDGLLKGPVNTKFLGEVTLCEEQEKNGHKKHLDSTELECHHDTDEKCAIEIGVEHSERGEERGEPEEVDELKKMYMLDDADGGSPPEVHRLNQPVNSCISCGRITDDTLWNLSEPSVSTETGVLVYEHRSPPGSYECTVSGLRWVCAGEVSLQYRLADPDIFKAQLEMLQYTPIGPLMDIKVLSGELDEAHLPHSACVEHSDSSFSDAVRVLRGDDSGVSLEKCAQLSCLHAKLRYPSFSLVGLLVKMRIPVWSLVDVLIYRTRIAPLTLFIYVVPRDASMIQAVEDEGRRIGGKRIDKHRPNTSIWMNAKVSLVSGMAEISPKEITLNYARPPDLFEVFVENANAELIDLELTSNGQSIWNVTLRPVDYSEATGVARRHPCVSQASRLTPTVVRREAQLRSGPTSHMEGRRELASLSNKERVFMVQSDLINRGSKGLLKGMLVSLQSQKPSVVSQWEVNEVLQGNKVLQDQWLSFLTVLQNKGNTACGIMLRLLRDLDYYFYEDLGL
ncbi:uncharacterized protein LOC134095924 isoform X2 [Sardina pilchardus]